LPPNPDCGRHQKARKEDRKWRSKENYARLREKYREKRGQGKTELKKKSWDVLSNPPISCNPRRMKEGKKGGKMAMEREMNQQLAKITGKKKEKVLVCDENRRKTKPAHHWRKRIGRPRRARGVKIGGSTLKRKEGKNLNSRKTKD